MSEGWEFEDPDGKWIWCETQATAEAIANGLGTQTRKVEEGGVDE